MKLQFAQADIPDHLRRFFRPAQRGCGACFVCHMVEVFREVKRVLRDDGVLWLNLGDSFASASACDRRSVVGQGSPSDECQRPNRLVNGLKEKDMVGIPWRCAFALQADGWWLRSDVIWSKLNPMPESVTDRPTRSHEYIFLLTKSARYFYDAEAVKEASVTGDMKEWPGSWSRAQIASVNDNRTDGFKGETIPSAGRNRRSVWQIATEPTPDAHFATFPTALVKPCVLAGTPEAGCCSACGRPWKRVVEKSVTHRIVGGRGLNSDRRDSGMACNADRLSNTLGFRPACTCGAPARPAVVLDPFSGSGTTCMVAKQLGRFAVGIDLKEDYHQMAVKRLQQDVLPLMAA